MLEILTVIALAAACMWAVAGPFLRPQKEVSASIGQDTAAEAAKEAKYREIRDAEADYRSGKLSDDEWRAVDADLRAEAIEILGEGDRSGTTRVQP